MLIKTPKHSVISEIINNLKNSSTLAVGGAVMGGDAMAMSGPVGLPQTKHARRIYLGGIQPGTTDRDISKFLVGIINAPRIIILAGHGILAFEYSLSVF